MKIKMNERLLLTTGEEACLEELKVLNNSLQSLITEVEALKEKLESPKRHGNLVYIIPQHKVMEF